MATDRDRFGNRLQYSFDDPERALRSAMQDEGLNPYAANPFTDMYMEQAPGLALAYAGDMAAGGMYGNPTDRGAPDFGTYLRNIIRRPDGAGDRLRAYTYGAPGSGGLQAAINNARNYRSALNSGAQNVNLNPYLTYLSDMFGNDGSGIKDALLATTAPMLGSRQLARSYGTGLNQSYDAAIRRFGQTGQIGRGPDIWNYILGF